MTLPRIQVGQLSLLTVDAGAHCGWAYWEHRKLMACGLYDFGKATMPPEYYVPSTQILVVEVPQWQHGDTPSKINNLFKCTQKGEYFAGRLRPVTKHEVNPHDWKGSVDKAVHNDRVLKRITDLGEVEAIRQCFAKVAPSLQNNVIDAIGLGLVILGRW